MVHGAWLIVLKDWMGDDDGLDLLGILPLTGTTFLTLETVGNPPQNYQSHDTKRPEHTDKPGSELPTHIP